MPLFTRILLQARLAQLAAERGDFAAGATRAAEDKGRLEKSLADARRKVHLGLSPACFVLFFSLYCVG